ncbi:NAD(P)H-dependent oxidoreductase [Devosia sp. XJ19-1]|uniref:NAD(P)H-dependent oxidoreductase n=1 Tax=Devosia ureilytica TaxID=2952754 RepID=A0A9Q4ANE4_9HYPH|nr:NAD(P)H-dependent oxidoreductase [Devosia ureilytica]MCP8886771.1 NAD(P)H-dependent oxidoreductase [Devosia ureilytica]
MPKCLVLNGHPLHPSFSGSIADRYGAILSRSGMDIQRLDLSALTIPELATRKPAEAEMTGDVARFWDAMTWADHVVIVHPLWWGGMPAKLKALFDIGLQSGKAYRYRPNNPLPLGLLAGRSVRLIVTSDTPSWFMALGYGNAHFRAMRRQVLKFIGLSPVRATHLSVIRHSTPQQRARLMARIDRDARADLQLLARTRRPAALAQSL